MEMVEKLRVEDDWKLGVQLLILHSLEKQC